MNYYLFFFFIIASHVANSQQLIITGKLSEADSKKPISYAYLTNITDKKYSTTSHQDGTFRLKVPGNSGDHKIYITAVGYRDTTLTVNQLKNTKTIFLKPRIYELPNVVVTGKRLEKVIVGDTLANIKSDEVDLFGFDSARVSWGGYVDVKRKYRDGYIKELNVYFTKDGFIGTELALRIHTFTGKFKFNYRLPFPQFRDLLPEAVIIKPKTPGWLTIDLSDYKIPVPKSGLYFIFTPLGQVDNYANYADGEKSYHANIGKYVKKNDAKHIYRVWQIGNEVYALKHSNPPATSIVILKEQ